MIATRKKILRRDFILWIILGILFIFLGIDEFASIHEKVGDYFRNRMNLTGYLETAWIVPYGIAVLVLFILYFKFLSRLPRRTRKYFVISGLIFVFGAIGFEIIATKMSKKDFSYHIIMTLEESFEMIGIALFIYTLLDYISTKYGYLGIKVSNKEDS
ncbi:hypothetical protein [Muriicola soli]|uniref:Uncharacterized protein n=1 Tax=Muriicola soli TaxID=2507538 RepID=A0A411EBA2_9FLAO|nr:hypothetical protein [Muriicola soli]QBA64720.1 hypothetical protein EQY75_09385 [Muriicola soli]